MTAAEFVRLIVGLVRGSPQAWGELVRTFEPILLRFLRKCCDSPTVRPVPPAIGADDIAQEIWLEFSACFTRAEFPDKKRLLAFLMSLAKCRLLHAIRAGHGKARDQDREEGIDACTDDLPSPQPGPLPIVADQDEIDFILAQLTDAERELVFLRDLGKNVPEIAEQLGVCQSTVRKRMLSIRRRVEQYARSHA